MAILIGVASMLSAAAAADVQRARVSDREVDAMIENVQKTVREFDRTRLMSVYSFTF